MQLELFAGPPPAAPRYDPLDWHGRWIEMPHVIVNVVAQTAAQAKYQIVKRAVAAGYRARYIDVRVRRGQWFDGVDVW